MPFDQRFEVLRDKEDIHQNTFTVISYFCKTLGTIRQLTCPGCIEAKPHNRCPHATLLAILNTGA